MIIQNYILKITKAAILLLAFVGLVIYPNSLYPDVFTKGLFVRFLILAAVTGFAWLLAFRKIYSPKMDGLAWAIVAFLGTTVVSMLFSPSIYRSFWGEAQRMEGVFSLLLYGGLFFVARSVFSENDWVRYFKLVIITAPVLSLYAVFQKAVFLKGGVNPFFFPVLNPVGAPGSLFGNPAFFAMFLIFAIGFAFFVFLNSEKKFWRRFSIFSIVVSAVTIFWLGIRGPFLGLLAGGLIFWGLWAFWQNRRGYRIYFAVFLLVIILGAGALVAFQDRFSDYYPRLIQRIVDLPREDSFLTRWYSLQSSWKAFLDSPKTFLIGWGQENFMVGYNKYYDPRHSSIEDVWFDRAHNKLADVAVTGGILGLTGYFAVWWLALRYAREIRRKKPSLAAGVIGTLTAYFLANLTLFDLPQTYVNFFLILAFIEFSRREDNVLPDKADAGEPSQAGLFGATVLTALALFLTVFSIVIPLRQSTRYLYYGREVHDARVFIQNSDKIFRPRNFAHYTLLDDFWRRLKNQDSLREVSLKPLTDILLEEYKYIADREPADAQVALKVANIYTERAIGFSGQEEFRLGEKYARRALALSPTRQEIYYQLAFNLQGQERSDEAVELMREALELNPDNRRARYNLAVNLALAGDIPAAIEEFEAVRKAGWYPGFDRDSRDFVNVLNIYVAGGRGDLIQEMIEEREGKKGITFREFLIARIRQFVVDEVYNRVVLWARAYQQFYPEVNDDMKVVIDLAGKGLWDELRAVTGLEPKDK